MEQGDSQYVLIADHQGDDRSLTEILVRQAGQGFVCHAPSNPVSLGQALASNAFQIAVIEANLAWCDAVDLAGQLRSANPACRIFFYSCEPLTSLKPPLARLGLEGYLLKRPGDLAQLPALLSQGAGMANDPAVTTPDPGDKEAVPAPSGGSSGAPEKAFQEMFREISHDLVQPVQLLVRQLDQFRAQHKKQLDAQGREAIKSMGQVAANLQSLLDGILDHYQPESNGRRGEFVPVSEVAAGVAAALEPDLAAVSGQLSLGRLPELRVDRGKMTRVFHNLLSNAIKYRGTEPLHIHVDALDVTGNWLFTVSDNGTGIEPEKAETIFDDRYRGNPAQGPAGQGLGLSICKRIVEESGGKIWARSRPGEGTTIHFTLPKAPSNVVNIG